MYGLRRMSQDGYWDTQKAPARGAREASTGEERGETNHPILYLASVQKGGVATPSSSSTWYFYLRTQIFRDFLHLVYVGDQSINLIPTYNLILIENLTQAPND